VSEPIIRGTGTLSVVATPIGNLEDITLRALRVLREAQAILAEDTRHTRTLLAHHGIGTPLRALHAHTPPAKIQSIAEELAAGARYAIVTDAGTPLVSDPGAELVRACLARGVTVTPIPGPSAPIAALVASGLGGASFEFLGFLPRSGGKRRDALEHVRTSRGAAIFFEAPSRLAATLADLERTLGAREVAVCRELTKLHEEVARGTPAALRAHFGDTARGEITIVVAALDPADEEPPSVEDLDDAIDAMLAAGTSTRDVADQLAEGSKLPRRDIYQRVLARAGVRSE
jgi:16S rRNA (cytidine1402-2'-O)-methyltransferase